MKYRRLGRTDLTVSEIALGTMTFGSQNTEAEAHAQMDEAVAAGVTLFDTAEMYPTTPLAKETVGRTEEMVGTGSRPPAGAATWWWRRRSRAAATTRCATERRSPRRRFARAAEASLRRLRTDVIDLYQIHWPNRGSYHFRKSWIYDPSGQDPAAVRANVEEVLRALADLVTEGKVRHVGLSNETCWGTAEFLKAAGAHGLPRVASIQNEYSLMCRSFDLDLAELSLNEDVGLLAYSPLAAGLLSGKYVGGERPAGSRATINVELGGRFVPTAIEAASAYAETARRHGLDPAQMALAFCLSRPFMASVIVGATSLEQLRNNLGAADLVLDEGIRAEIGQLHRRYPTPM